MDNLIKDIANMTKSGVSIYKIVDWTGLKIAEIRKIMLENNIYPSENDKEYRYFEDALTLKKHAKDAYFYKDLAKITQIPLNRTKFLAEIYNIKPSKKAICTVCGAEISLTKSTIVNKYCSKACSDVKNKPKRERKPIIKTCIYCNKTFEGKPNSKYCSDTCKRMYNEVEDTVRWLRG